MEVAEFFSGKSIFVTGATGFMGKVLIEKLLRSCYGIDRIYALVRPGKKGESIEERIQKLHDFPLFDRLKAERPGDLERKLVGIPGEISALGLGLSPQDRAMLTERVAIVYHLAATVRFDQPLHEAIIMNVRGTRDVCELVMQMRRNHPDVILVHLSTAFAHTDRKVIEEIMYPPHGDWREAIEVAEHMDPLIIKILTQKYMGQFPNTYTFTKSLGEHVVNDICGKDGNTVIIRPTIVVSTYEEPMPAWVDNVNGPVGMMVATTAGVSRITYGDKSISGDFIPVDSAIKIMILATWKESLKKRSESTNKNEANVYNSCKGSLSFQEVLDLSNKLLWELDAAVEDTIWFPSFATTKNFTWFYINFMLFQLLPAVIIDQVFKLASIKKRSLVKVQRTIYIVSNALVYFGINQWEFKSKSAHSLDFDLSENEKAIFQLNLENYDYRKHLRESCIGFIVYVLKEPLIEGGYYLAQRKKLYYLDRFVKVAFFVILSWWGYFVLLPYIGLDTADIGWSRTHILDGSGLPPGPLRGLHAGRTTDDML